MFLKFVRIVKKVKKNGKKYFMIPTELIQRYKLSEVFVGWLADLSTYNPPHVILDFFVKT